MHYTEEMPGEKEVESLTEDELEEQLQLLAREFLAELTDLCNAYGFQLGVCAECEDITMFVSDGLLEKYVLDGNHVIPKTIIRARTI